MALPAVAGSPTTPPVLPPVGQGGPPGTPPAGGAGGMTMPTPNLGMKAAALGQLTWVVRILEKSLPMLGVETEVGRDVMKALTSLSKHIPPGSGSPGVEQSALQKMMMEQKAEQPMLQMLRQQGAATQPPPVAAPAVPRAA